MAPCSLPPVLANQAFLPQSQTSYVQSVSALSSGGAEYTTLGQLGPQGDTAAPAKRPPQDFYTCVQMMKESGEVHLVPCLPPEHGRDLPPPPWSGEKTEKMADYQLRMGSGQSSGSADPLVSVAVDNQG